MRQTLFLLILLGLTGVPAPAATDNALKGGVAVADITPPLGFRMSGYFSERLATGLHDPLQAKAVFLSQGAEQAALVFCDLSSISLDVSRRTRQQASAKTGVPASNIVIAATHSHTGPLYWGPLRDYFHNAAVERDGKDPHESIDYPAFLVERLVEAIARAKDAAQPIELAAGSAQQASLSFNRRFLLKDGTVRTNPGKKNPDIVRPVGPIDPEVGLLSIRTRGAGLLAALTVFALHLDTVGGTLYSADYPFYLQQVLRGEFGERFVSAFGAGTCGNINHIDVSSAAPQKGQEEAERIGARLAETVRAALPKLSRLSRPSLKVRNAVVEAPLQRYTPEQLEQARRDIAQISSNDLPFLRKVEAGRVLSLQSLGRRSWPVEVQVFRLSNDTALVTLPGEVFVELGLAIKRASPFRHTVVIELANDGPAYIPTRRAYEEGGYEVVNSRLEAGGGELLVATAVRLLRELKP